MTPAEKAGIMRGKYFKCTQAYDAARDGYQKSKIMPPQSNGKLISSRAVVTLHEDDGTNFPVFRVVEGECSFHNVDMYELGCHENFPLHPEWLEELPNYKEEE